MPRKNKVVKHTPYQFTNREAGKTRYGTKSAAEKAADYQMLINPGLELYVYRSEVDGGWYLTRSSAYDKERSS